MGSTDDGRVAIVTGAVSGIGEAIARHLVGRGWRVAAFDIQDDLGKTITDDLGASFYYIHCDVRSYEDQAAAFQKTFDKFGKIDALCHNAGLIDQYSVYRFDYRGKKGVPPKPNLNSTETCYHGLIYGTQLAVHFMRQNPIPGGTIVATGSSVGIHPIGSMPEYCGAKAAINNYVRATAPILKLKEKIRINCVNPGIVATRNIPEVMRVSFDGYVTPVETIVAGYDRALNDQSLNGELLECSLDRIHLLPVPPYSDGDVLKKTTSVYDGLFIALHGERSGLPEAVQ
ncbi:uncharacterized protein HMPREF1541_04959 [Cyphellophora europaea CBS 101466]|uniref:Uncharacterized protein n=1 Tax=Cyphellophora europaea (strain CBS 101466) TaxID=1220924 RepID=W2RWI2_CYPE1|nr:uncharacterized protein HMPREF1541_04959 [Cyphellophora europaea CBS 101466]ETN40680.1 hypothetical protein HMPREF1541_04959 [Cyphellophora europaea CBS 101466]